MGAQYRLALMTRIKAWTFHLLQWVLRKLRWDLEPLSGQGKPGELMMLQGVDVVLDVGAAVGNYGRWIREAGYEGRICSFEPLSAAFKQLERNTSDDPLWKCRKLALGPEPGTAEINIAGNSDSSSLLPMEERHEQSAPSSVYIGTETVEVATLDGLWEEVVGDARRPFLKLDVQGYELETLRGGVESLPKLHGIQAELSLVPLYEGGPLWLDVIEFLREHGFHVAGVEAGHTDPESGEMLQADGIFIRD
jgi:FkbM family methyltransferase